MYLLYILNFASWFTCMTGGWGGSFYKTILNLEKHEIEKLFQILWNDLIFIVYI